MSRCASVGNGDSFVSGEGEPIIMPVAGPSLAAMLPVPADLLANPDIGREYDSGATSFIFLRT